MGAWLPGTAVLMRYFYGEHLHQVRPVTVVEDTEDGTVLWLAGGSQMMRSELVDGRDARAVSMRERILAPQRLVRAPWSGTGILILVPPRGAHSVWLFWSETGAFRGWYGNLEEPHGRWHGGLDTTDHALDVWVTADGHREWLDEDEFTEATGLPGCWTTEDVPAIRAEGQYLMELASRAAAPFDQRWVDFRPDPSWALPILPEGWDAPRYWPTQPRQTA